MVFSDTHPQSRLKAMFRQELSASVGDGETTVLAELSILLASCNASSGVSGACVAECPTSQGAAYTICSERETKSTSSSESNAPKPKRLCTYYVNGTIDIPTSSVITAWVEVGSRACIGDPPPISVEPVVRTAADQVRDAFTAYATRPFAYLNPNRQVEITEPVNFGVNLGGGTHGGTLFGSAAQIRFVATGVHWNFSDGQSRNGRFVTVSFSDPQRITANASVSYRIDYRYPAADWVLGAASASLETNTIGLDVIDPPRRTLLRD